MQEPGTAGRKWLAAAGVAAACGLLALFTTYHHATTVGLAYLETGTQLDRHRAVIDGVAGNPWQYRVLAPWLIELLMRAVGALGVPHPVAVAFLAFRTAQDAIVSGLAYVFYRRLGAPTGLALLGISLLAWGTSHSTFDSDLQFSTYLDVAFYLAAGICLVQARWAAVVPLAALAALNRETSGLIPIMLLAVGLRTAPPESRLRIWITAAAAAGAFGAVLLGLRLAYGAQPLLIPYGHRPGWDLLWYNISRPVTWVQTVSTLGIIPVVALAGRRAWPPALAAIVWAVVPVWMVIHWFGAVAAESRLFLVPQAVAFIPGALCVACLNSKGREADAARPFTPDELRHPAPRAPRSG